MWECAPIRSRRVNSRTVTPPLTPVEVGSDESFIPDIVCLRGEAVWGWIGGRRQDREEAAYLGPES